MNKISSNGEIEESQKREGESQMGWDRARKFTDPHLSMLDLVSAILLRLATRKP